MDGRAIGSLDGTRSRGKMIVRLKSDAKIKTRII